MTGNVVSIFKRPNDEHWTEQDRQSVLFMMEHYAEGNLKKLASSRQCKIMAAICRELAAESPDEALALMRRAEELSRLGDMPGRRRFHPSELKALTTRNGLAPL